MIRRTITLNDAIYNELQKIRASVIRAGRDISFTTIVNVVLLGGIVGADSFDARTWRIIKNFVDQTGVELEIEAIRDQYADMIKEIV